MHPATCLTSRPGCLTCISNLHPGQNSTPSGKAARRGPSSPCFLWDPPSPCALRTPPPSPVPLPLAPCTRLVLCPSATRPQPGRRPHTGGQVRNELPLLPSRGGRRGLGLEETRPRAGPVPERHGSRRSSAARLTYLTCSKSQM